MDLALIDLHLHCAARDQPVDEALLFLPVTEYSADSLRIVARVPSRVQQHHPICCNQVDPKTPSFRREQEHLVRIVAWRVKRINHALPLRCRSGTVEPKIRFFRLPTVAIWIAWNHPCLQQLLKHAQRFKRLREDQRLVAGHHSLLQDLERNEDFAAGFCCPWLVPTEARCRPSDRAVQLRRRRHGNACRLCTCNILCMLLFCFCVASLHLGEKQVWVVPHFGKRVVRFEERRCVCILPRHAVFEVFFV